MTLKREGALRHLLIAQVWAFVIFLPGLSVLNDPTSRYLLFWQRRDGLIRLGCVVAFGLVLFGVHRLLLRRLPERARDLLLCILAPMLLSSVGWRIGRMGSHISRHAYGKYVAVVLLCLILCVVASIRWRLTPRRWADWIARGSAFLAPVVPVFWISVLRVPGYDLPQNPPVSRTAAVEPVKASGARDDVYILVLDAWPFRYLFKNGRVREDYPYLHAAAAGMCVFTQAFAPGCHTMHSLPRLLFQRNEPFALRGQQVGFVGDEGFAPARASESLFGAARRKGYRTYMIGWYHPYGLMLGDSVDLLVTSGHSRWAGPGAWREAGQFLYDGAFDLLGATLSGWLYPRRPRPVNLSFVRNTELVLSHLEAAIDDPRPGQYVVAHLPLPHFPFCYGEQGQRPLEGQYGLWHPDQIYEQLRYTDRLLGKLFERMREAGKYDRATIVLTADHTLRIDPTLERLSARKWSHVPLLIKLPGQRERLGVSAPVTLSRLARLLDRARQVQFRLAPFAALLASEEFHTPVSDEEAQWSGIKPLIR